MRFKSFMNLHPLLKSFLEMQLQTVSYNAMFDRAAFIDTAKLEDENPESIIQNWNCIFVLANTTNE